MSTNCDPVAHSTRFIRRATGVAVFGVLLVAGWYLRDLLLLVFAATLFACLLVSVSQFIAHLSRLPLGIAFGLSCLMTLLIAIGFFWLLGSQLRTQMMELWEQLPELLKPIENALNIGSVEEWLGDQLETMLSQTSVMSRIAGLSSAAFGFLANLVLVIVAGFYLALQPDLYVRGIVKLFPQSKRPAVENTLADIGGSLRYWLIGQSLAMLVVAGLTYIGLALIGVPSALALAVIAGLLEFIPFFGPILAAVPAVALGLGQGPHVAAYVAILYLAIQQLEGNLITPVIQQQSVSLPPALTLFAILAAGILFGWLGILLATPLAVALMVLVREVWVAPISTARHDAPEASLNISLRSGKSRFLD